MNFNSGTPSALSEASSQSFARTITDYFVNGALGNDNFDGSRNNPFETIGRAIMQSQHDSRSNRIVIAPGNYNENLIVNDFTGLWMQGDGSSPHDVVVNGNNMGTGLKIEGGSEIELENMSFKYGMNGIFAENVNNLKLSNVVARNNSGYGFTANNIGDVDVNQSNFLVNGFSGARIANSNSVEFDRGLYFQNADNGLELDNNSFVKVNRITASENGFDDFEGSPSAIIGHVGNGLAAFRNDELEIHSSNFLNNLQRGIDVQSNHEVSLLKVTAIGNRQDGAGGDDNHLVFVRDGRYNGNRFGDGISLFSNFEDSRQFGENGNGGSSIRVVGGSYWGNSSDGFYVNGYDEVELVSLDAQHNGFDGVLVQGSGNAVLERVHSSGNGDDGVEVDSVRNLNVNRLYAASNQNDGLFVVGDSFTEMVNINHGDFNHNGNNGIRVSGFFESRLNRANIRRATSTENGGSGLSINATNYGAVVGGMFSKNGVDGIDLLDAGRMKLEYVVAKSNAFDGLYSSASGFGGTSDPGFENGNGSTFRGSLDIKQSSFKTNQLNGITIAGIGVASDNGSRQSGEGSPDYFLTLNMDRVIAEKNDGHGVFFGNPNIILEGSGSTARETGAATNVRFEANFEKGFFGINGLDGIHASASGLFLGGFGVNLDGDIKLNKITAIQNGGNGFYSDFSQLLFPVPVLTESGITGNSGNFANVGYHFNRGTFNHNGGDGISVFGSRYLGDSGAGFSSLNGDESQPEFLAEGVSASHNGGTGLSFRTQRNSFDFPDSTESGGYQSELVAKVDDGDFNNNGFDGININVDTDQPYGGPIGSLVVVEKAIAKRNGQNGLRIVGQGLTTGHEGVTGQYGLNADIIRGVFNSNHQDGVHLVNLGDVYLDRPTGVSNDDDGLEGINIVDVFGDWTFVANGDQNFILH